MEKGYELKKKKVSFKSFIVKNKTLVILMISLILGIVSGSLLLKNADESTKNYINILFLNNFKPEIKVLPWSIFVSSVSSTFIFIIMIFFMGLSAWGFVLIPFIPVLRGLCIGFCEGYLYSSFGIKGLIFHLVVLFPGIILSSLAIILMSKEAMKISYNISSTIFLDEHRKDSRDFLRSYIMRTGCVMIIIVVSSVVDLIFNLLFSGLFFK